MISTVSGLSPPHTATLTVPTPVDTDGFAGGGEDGVASRPERSSANCYVQAAISFC